MKALPLKRPSALRPSGLTRCLQQANPLEASVLSVRQHAVTSPCTRSLSSTAPRQDKSRRISVPRRKTAATFDVPQFSTNDIPPARVLDAMLAHPATPAYLSGMTGAQCRNLLSDYATRTLSLADPARDFRQVFDALLQRGKSSDPLVPECPEAVADKARALEATLHSIAGMLVQGPPGPVYNLALHILHALCKLDYEPSFLTVSRIALVSRKVGQAQFAPAVDRFERLVKSMTAGRPAPSSSSSKKTKKRRKGSNVSSAAADDDAVLEVDWEEVASLRSNAFTLKGMMVVASNQDRPTPSPEGYREALKYFEAAMGGSPTQLPKRSRAGSPVPYSTFDWQIPCMVEMGHCYAALGAFKQAHAAWKFAAEELDDKDATALYAIHALQPDDPAREALLLKAAISNSKLAIDEVNRLNHDKMGQQNAGDNEEGKKNGSKWDILLKKVVRDEWEKLASPPPTGTGTK
ncbi:hypothetical protein PG985_010113 [Apiospora marii]|uniref:uncharacterized protein n=1 Tax=Apiospora marii TaxID=335849 RepID=UPI00312F5E6E